MVEVSTATREGSINGEIVVDGLLKKSPYGIEKGLVHGEIMVDG